ncbi:WecB/TagA/CpsF family glycosyltransferase [Methylopila sp. M107]|uniref:WecB/TagA/CpsF family glycosyltransferase n=1 Tax=Methylopila sp. M107 TaxID=1101190 RepID=UPI00036547FC|nr:WecB/TagA/CpsF family glycosyltransferase [Methylopila sp. M107]
MSAIQDWAAIEPTVAPHVEPDLKVSFLGLLYDRTTIDGVVTRLLARPSEAPFASVVTPNAAHLSRIDGDPSRYAAPYRNAWLCLNDSRVVEILGRTCGVAIEAAPGSDLVAALLSDPRLERDSRILLVGGDKTLFEDLKAKAGLTGALHYEAPMGLATNENALAETVAYIETHPARFVLLAVGSPQQEFIAEALRSGGRATGVGLCVGAAVEFLTDRRRRAPGWMSRSGLEWLFRLVSEPRRMWRRYLVDSPAVLRLYLRHILR